jgi:cbb3-type cytochrome oxidase subunit 3
MIISKKLFSFINLSSFFTGFFVSHFYFVYRITKKKHQDTQTDNENENENENDLNKQIYTIDNKPNKYKWIFI